MKSYALLTVALALTLKSTTAEEYLPDLKTWFQANKCMLPWNRGPCNGEFKRYYYDDFEKRCRSFTYGGCLGNENNFGSRELCTELCDQRCTYTWSKDQECEHSKSAYVYRPDKKKCEKRGHTACSPLSFDKLKTCKKTCEPKPPSYKPMPPTKMSRRIPDWISDEYYK